MVKENNLYTLDTAGAGELPSLEKEGWPRHQVNGPFL